MTKSLAFSPAIPGKLVLLPVISGKLVLLPAISGKWSCSRQFQASWPCSQQFQASWSCFWKFQASWSCFRQFHTTKNCIQLPSFQTDCCNAVFLFSVFIPSGFCIQVDFISGSHTQTKHNFRLSHPNQSQFQALTPKPITISGSHISPAIYPTYCSFRSPLR